MGFDIDKDEIEENIQVLLRIRPINAREANEGATSCLKIDQDNSSTVCIDSKNFSFDHIAPTHSSQEDIFRIAGKPIAQSWLQGYNTCIFAYGQTGAGKTYTMSGSESDRGLQSRVLEYVFGAFNHANKEHKITYKSSEQSHPPCDFAEELVSCSYLEIYNEQLIDLLSADAQQQTKESPSFQQQQPCLSPVKSSLSIREHISNGVYVDNLTVKPILNAQQAIQAFQSGQLSRHIGATLMNESSSRSHTLFTLNLQVKVPGENGSAAHIRHSKLHFVDLAGSERQKSTGTTGGRLKEASNINKSLTVLAQVINALVEQASGRNRHVPYRDSKLTFILKDSLGGNSKTFMIAACSEANIHFQETLSTLKFAQRAKLIKNKALVNEESEGSMQELKKEIEILKQQLAQTKQGKNALKTENSDGYYQDNSPANQQQGDNKKKAIGCFSPMNNLKGALGLYEQRFKEINGKLNELEGIVKSANETNIDIIDDSSFEQQRSITLYQDIEEEKAMVRAGIAKAIELGELRKELLGWFNQLKGTFQECKREEEESLVCQNLKLQENIQLLHRQMQAMEQQNILSVKQLQRELEMERVNCRHYQQNVQDLILRSQLLEAQLNRAHNSISESRIASFRAMAESRVEIEEQFGQHHDHSKLENTENSNNEPASCCDCYDKQFELEKEIEKLKEQMAQQLAQKDASIEKLNKRIEEDKSKYELAVHSFQENLRAFEELQGDLLAESERYEEIHEKMKVKLHEELDEQRQQLEMLQREFVKEKEEREKEKQAKVRAQEELKIAQDGLMAALAAEKKLKNANTQAMMAAEEKLCAMMGNIEESMMGERRIFEGQIEDLQLALDVVQRKLKENERQLEGKKKKCVEKESQWEGREEEEGEEEERMQNEREELQVQQDKFKESQDRNTLKYDLLAIDLAEVSESLEQERAQRQAAVEKIEIQVLQIQFLEGQVAEVQRSLAGERLRTDQLKLKVKKYQEQRRVVRNYLVKQMQQEEELQKEKEENMIMSRRDSCQGSDSGDDQEESVNDRTINLGYTSKDMNNENHQCVAWLQQCLRQKQIENEGISKRLEDLQEEMSQKVQQGKIMRSTCEGCVELKRERDIERNQSKEIREKLNQIQLIEGQLQEEISRSKEKWELHQNAYEEKASVKQLEISKLQNQITLLSAEKDTYLAENRMLKQDLQKSQRSAETEKQQGDNKGICCQVACVVLREENQNIKGLLEKYKEATRRKLGELEQQQLKGNDKTKQQQKKKGMFTVDEAMTEITDIAVLTLTIQNLQKRLTQLPQIYQVLKDYFIDTKRKAATADKSIQQQDQMFLNSFSKYFEMPKEQVTPEILKQALMSVVKHFEDQEKRIMFAQRNIKEKKASYEYYKSRCAEYELRNEVAKHRQNNINRKRKYSLKENEAPILGEVDLNKKIKQPTS